MTPVCSGQKEEGGCACRWMPTVLRLGRGMVRYPGAAAEAPAKPLRLWSYESNQFARLVRAFLIGLLLLLLLSEEVSGHAPKLCLHPPCFSKCSTVCSSLA